MKKKLPHIIIRGIGNTMPEKVQSLVEIETILVMAGYNGGTQEGWNNNAVTNYFDGKLDFLHAVDGDIEYHSHNCDAKNVQCFNANEIKDAINYLRKEGYLN